MIEPKDIEALIKEIDDLIVYTNEYRYKVSKALNTLKMALFVLKDDLKNIRVRQNETKRIYKNHLGEWKI